LTRSSRSSCAVPEAANGWPTSSSRCASGATRRPPSTPTSRSRSGRRQTSGAGCSSRTAGSTTAGAERSSAWPCSPIPARAAGAMAMSEAAGRSRCTCTTRWWSSPTTRTAEPSWRRAGTRSQSWSSPNHGSTPAGDPGPSRQARQRLPDPRAWRAPGGLGLDSARSCVPSFTPYCLRGKRL